MPLRTRVVLAIILIAAAVALLITTDDLALRLFSILMIGIAVSMVIIWWREWTGSNSGSS